jgi:hypothetical protein
MERTSTPWLTPLLVAGGTYGVWLLFVLNGWQTHALTGGTAGIPDGFRRRHSLIAWQVIWFGSLAFAGTLWHVRRSGRSRTVIIALTALLVLGSGTALRSLGPAVSEPDPGAQIRWNCRGEHPQVCVTSEFRAQLNSFDQEIKLAGWLTGEYGPY